VVGGLLFSGMNGLSDDCVNVDQLIGGAWMDLFEESVFLVCGV